MAKEDDLEVYEKQGLGARMGFGKNPLLQLDLQRNFEALLFWES